MMCWTYFSGMDKIFNVVAAWGIFVIDPTLSD